MRYPRFVVASGLSLGLATNALSQGIPTSQPSLIQIMREEVKIGHSEDHARHEMGWPAAFARAKSPDYYLALASITGPNEVWYVGAYASHAALGESMKRDAADPVLSAELARLSKADAAHLNSLRTVHAIGRSDLSGGAYPDLAMQRFFEVSIWRVRPGFEQDFETVVKSYASAAKRAAPGASWRMYEIVAGIPGPTFMIFSSSTDMAVLDGAQKEFAAVMAAVPPTEGAFMQKFVKEGMINIETQRFRLDPRQSYVSAEVRQRDPAFWNVKAPARAAGSQ